MRAAVYLRQSLDPTGEGLAVARQREDCLKLCKQRGWEPVEYVDNDRSATKGKRPSYERMLKDIEAGKLDAVVAWDLDRLHRRPIELEHFINLADKKKLALATIGGDADLSTDNGRLFARIKGAVARAEVERKSARQKRAYEQRAASGIGWGNRAFGYNGDHKNPKLVRKEANAIRKAYHDVLNGVALHTISQRWNKAGLLTPRGKLWYSTTVRQVLRNPRNAGWRAHRGQIVGPGNWPAIIDDETFKAVDALLTQPGRRLTDDNRRKRLLGGMIICGACNRVMWSSGRKIGDREQDKYPVYKCKRPDCMRVSRKSDVVDEFVIEAVLERLSRFAWALPEHKDSVKELHREINQLQQRIDSLAEDFAEGDLTPSQMRIATKKLSEKLAAAQARLARTVEANTFSDFVGVEGREQIEKVWDSLDLDRKRQLIGSLCTITLEPIGKGRWTTPGAGIRIAWHEAGNSGDT